MKKHKLFFLLLVCFFYSCATNPRFNPGEEEGNEFSLLPDGGLLYLWVDPDDGRPLIEHLFFENDIDRDTQNILSRTRSITAVLFSENENETENENERSYYLAAFGNYPRSMANMSFTFSRAWRTQRSGTGNRYWYSRSSELSLALGKNVALVSDYDPFFAPLTGAEGQSAVIVPSDFTNFKQGHALAAWLRDPGEFIDTFFEEMGLPIRLPAEAIFIGITRLPESLWEISIHIKTPSERDARTLQAGFNIAMLFLRRAQDIDFGNPIIADLFFANPLEQDREFLVFRSPEMDLERVALLFGLF